MMPHPVSPRLLTKNPALSVYCPTCEAEPGFHCTTLNGHKTFRHTARSDVFQARKEAA